MIAIVNITNSTKPTGIHKYELRINSKVIAEFDHTREDGLEVCLRKAADAARSARNEEILRIVDYFSNEGRLVNEQ